MINIKRNDLDDLLLNLQQNIASYLMAEYKPGGFWEGRLSDSALSTATGIFALAKADKDLYQAEIRRGTHWLATHQNEDGGFGDTPISPSNLSTTMLCWSALSHLAEAGFECADALEKTEAWIRLQIGEPHPKAIKNAVLANYGHDLTFSAPILTMCALAGRMGPSPRCWREVPALPFELAVLPHQLFKWLQLNVVSYAIPALIAVGWVRHYHHRAFGPIGWLRHSFRKRVMQVLEELQPVHGGFLEATPLTSFVVMCLCEAGYRKHPVVNKGVEFILSAIRPNGGWPIDSNLSLWVTTLAVKAFHENPGAMLLSESTRQAIREWLLSAQFHAIHPFTKSAPGGWPWTGLPGAAPDADDTSGALLALGVLGPSDVRSLKAAEDGIGWLLQLQNADGGIPTFCRGWGKLPFDQSCPDITAHALRAIHRWRPELNPELRCRVERGIRDALRYLAATQRHDGAWLPLWFGNQAAVHHQNPTYGTAQVLMALDSLCPQEFPGIRTMRAKGLQWLMAAQNRDGGWGGAPGIPASIEETSLALSALAGFSEARDCIAAGFDWLHKTTDGGRKMEPSPIGLYFASLWYEEELYPWVFALTAINRNITQ